MAERPIRRWTLRELFNGSERYSREMIDHLRKEILPSVGDLQRLLSRARSDPSAIDNAARSALYVTTGTEQSLSQLAEIYEHILKFAQHERAERS